MLALHIALWALLGTCLAFSIIELGLVAHAVAFYGGTRKETYLDPFGRVVSGTVHLNNPYSGISDFLLFTACWSILASVAAVVLPWFYTRKGAVTAQLNTILGVSSCVVFFITSVFWLAGFADIANILAGFASIDDNLSAIIAFAVLLWLLFLAVFILTVLALCGVLVSDWAGYQSMRNTRSADAPASAPVPMTQETREVAQEEHTGTAPRAPSAPSELSSHDAEATHNQSVSRAHSTAHSSSPPSAIASIELGSDTNARNEHAASHV